MPPSASGNSDPNWPSVTQAVSPSIATAVGPLSPLARVLNDNYFSPRIASAADVTSETHQNRTLRLIDRDAGGDVARRSEQRSRRRPEGGCGSAQVQGTQPLGTSPVVGPRAGQRPFFFRAAAEIVIGAVERFESHWCASAETASSLAVNTSFRAAARRHSLSLRWRVRSWASG